MRDIFLLYREKGKLNICLIWTVAIVGVGFLVHDSSARKSSGYGAGTGAGAELFRQNVEDQAAERVFGVDPCETCNKHVKSCTPPIKPEELTNCQSCLAGLTNENGAKICSGLCATRLCKQELEIQNCGLCSALVTFCEEKPGKDCLSCTKKVEQCKYCRQQICVQKNCRPCWSCLDKLDCDDWEAASGCPRCPSGLPCAHCLKCGCDDECTRTYCKNYLAE